MNTALSQSFSFTNLQSFINIFLGLNVIPCVNYSIFKFMISNFFGDCSKFPTVPLGLSLGLIVGTSSTAIIYQLLIVFKTDTDTMDSLFL